jgi:hypothetical protein
METGMNVLLLCLVLPLFVVLLVYDAWLVYRKYYASAEDRAIAWGGLQGSVFYAWVLTFLLSSFGCTSSFVMYASLDPPESFSIVLFVLMNVSYIAFNWALLGERKNWVLVTLWTNVVVYTVLFVYTAVTFKAASAEASAGLLVATHVCNFVSVVHVYVMELMIWHTGWTDARAEYENSQWSVKARTNGGACAA